MYVDLVAGNVGVFKYGMLSVLTWERLDRLAEADTVGL